MVNSLKSQWVSVLIVLWLLGSYLMPTATVFGARADLTTVGNPWTFTNTAADGGVTLASTTISKFKVGQIGTKLDSIIVGSCNLSTSNTASFTASTTVLAHCSSATTASVTSGHTCTVVGTGNATAGLSTLANNGVHFTGFAKATTTGYFGIELLNNSGVATTSYAQATTSVGFICADPS